MKPRLHAFMLLAWALLAATIACEPAALALTPTAPVPSATPTWLVETATNIRLILTPEGRVTPTATRALTDLLTPSATATASSTATASPTATETPVPTWTPEPSATPTPSSTPTETPWPTPTRIVPTWATWDGGDY